MISNPFCPLASQAPLLIFKHYIIHFHWALSGCWIRMWKSAGCKLKKIYLVPPHCCCHRFSCSHGKLKYHRRKAVSPINSQVEKRGVWRFDLTDPRTVWLKDVAVESWRLDLFLFLFCFFKETCIISRIRHMAAFPSWFQRDFDFPLTLFKCELPKKVSEVPRKNHWTLVVFRKRTSREKLPPFFFKMKK